MVYCQRGALGGRGLVKGVGPIIHTRRRPIPCGAAAIAAATCTLAWFSRRVMHVPEGLTLQTATHLESVPVCSLSLARAERSIGMWHCKVFDHSANAHYRTPSACWCPCGVTHLCGMASSDRVDDLGVLEQETFMILSSFHLRPQVDL